MAPYQFCFQSDKGACKALKLSGGDLKGNEVTVNCRIAETEKLAKEFPVFVAGLSHGKNGEMWEAVEIFHTLIIFFISPYLPLKKIILYLLHIHFLFVLRYTER